MGELLRKHTIEAIIAVGERLTDSKSRLKHGEWAPWLKKNFGWSDSTALNLMNVHKLAISEEFKSVNFKELGIAVSALYALARPSTPKEVQAKVIVDAKTGKQITIEDVNDALHPTPTETSDVNGRESRTEQSTHTALQIDGVEALSVAADESKREEVTETEDDTPREPDYQAKLRDTRGWAAEITTLALKCVRYRNLAAKHMDAAVLREVVNDQMLAGWCEGYENLGTLIDKVKSVLAFLPVVTDVQSFSEVPRTDTKSDPTTETASNPPAETASIDPAVSKNEENSVQPNLMPEDTVSETTSDEGASSETASENATSDITT